VFIELQEAYAAVWRQGTRDRWWLQRQRLVHANSTYSTSMLSNASFMCMTCLQVTASVTQAQHRVNAPSVNEGTQ
jgi:hypothetical protein